MITVTVDKKYGVATIRTNVTAPSIRRAVEIARRGAGEGTPGKDVRVIFPTDPEEFFASGEATGTQPVPAIA